MTKNATIRDLVTALRSGEYPKGRGALRAKDGSDTAFSFCCEGVMCELSELPRVGESEPDEDGIVATKYRGDGQNSAITFAPASVWVGTGMETHGNGQVAGVKIPSYSVDLYHYEETGEVRLINHGVDQVSLASLNDYTPIDPKNAFTFSQIADLLEWYYLND